MEQQILVQPSLCCPQVEAETRAGLYEAQITKMQLALERADQEKARLEEELTTALAGVKAVQVGC